MNGTIVALWSKRAHRGPMDAKESLELVAGRGVKGSANQGGKRQVTIIDETAWREATAEAGGEVDPSRRRANVMLRGLDLENTRGRILKIGECTLRVMTETTPCERMDEAFPGLRAAMRPKWRGGVSCVIETGGAIRVGDVAEWVPSSAE